MRIAKHEAAGKSIVYIDESGFASDMPRQYGYSLRGSRCYGACDWGAKGRVNAIGAQLGNSLLTVSLFNGTVNSDVFAGWVEYDLLPSVPSQSVLVLDNAAFHKRQDILDHIARAGHTIEFLPPYSGFS